MDTKITPLPWVAKQMRGWGDDVCIGPANMSEPLFKAVRQKAYYTDYYKNEDGATICCSKTAEKHGNYVATPEIQAAVLAQEAADAAFIVKAVNTHDQLVAALKAARDMIYAEVADGGYTAQAALIREALFAAEGK